MLTHEELLQKMLENPAVRAEYERIEREEMPALDAMLKARRKTTPVPAKQRRLLQRKSR